MKKISAAASGAAAPPPPPEPKPEPLVPTFSAVSDYTGEQNDKSQILLAIKPLLKDEKQGKVDALVRAMATAKMISNLKHKN